MSESSLRAKRLVRSDEITSEERERIIAEDLERLAAMTDDEIDFSDIPEVTDFTGWERGTMYRPVKDQVTLRIDRDVLHWFKHSHEKYQTAINQALRDHIDRERAVKSNP